MKPKDMEGGLKKMLVVVPEIKEKVLRNLKECLEDLEKKYPNDKDVLDGACMAAMTDILGELGAYMIHHMNDDKKGIAIEGLTSAVGMAVVMRLKMHEAQEKKKNMQSAMKN